MWVVLAVTGVELWWGTRCGPLPTSSQQGPVAHYDKLVFQLLVCFIHIRLYTLDRRHRHCSKYHRISLQEKRPPAARITGLSALNSKPIGHADASPTKPSLQQSILSPRPQHLTAPSHRSTINLSVAHFKHRLKRKHGHQDFQRWVWGTGTTNTPGPALQIQDGQDSGCGQLLSRQGVCAHRYRAILCRKGHQQEAYGRPRTHGGLNNCRLEGAFADTCQVRNEIAVLKRVSMGHRNILTLVDYFETMNNRLFQLPRRCILC